MFVLFGLWVPVVLLGILGLPLILQDIKDDTVSQWLLILITLIWWASATTTAEPESRLVAAAVVLFIGAILSQLVPDRLGEADIIFMSGMASLFSFWTFIFAIALACLAALSIYLWMFRKNGDEAMLHPIPFLPSLYWGGLTVSLGGLLF